MLVVLAMAGVWFGPASIAWAALWTLLAGGALSLAVAACSGVLPRVLGNLREILLQTLVQALGAKAPYTRGHSSRVSHYSLKIAERQVREHLLCGHIARISGVYFPVHG